MRSFVATLRRKARQVVRNNRGFTLIEILIVVAIIGVLAAIAVPNVTRALQTAKQNADAANIALLENAVNMYFIDTGNWPEEGPGFQTVLVDSGYLKEEVASPLGGTYTFTLSENDTPIVARQAQSEPPAQ